MTGTDMLLSTEWLAAISGTSSSSCYQYQQV